MPFTLMACAPPASRSVPPILLFKGAGTSANNVATAEAIGHWGEATRDYNRALSLDPNLAPALVNRAALAYRNERYDQAIADLGRALALATGTLIRSQLQYNLALAYLARGERAAAFASSSAAANHGHKEAAALVERLRRYR
jgi:tetratricopeptide (TPR) repeat protein